MDKERLEKCAKIIFDGMLKNESGQHQWDKLTALGYSDEEKHMALKGVDIVVKQMVKDK